MALSAAEIDRRLAALPGWAREGGTITKTYRFRSYLAGLSFVERVARGADAADHHPDLRLGYRQVAVAYSTHSAGGVTEKDLEGARRAEEAFASE